MAYLNGQKVAFSPNFTLIDDESAAFKAGQVNVLESSEALKGSKVGEAYILLDDISPAEHDLKVNLERKNLFNPAEYSLYETTVDDNGIFTSNFSDGTVYINRSKTTITPAGKYTLSVIPASTSVEFNIYAYATDKTTQLKFFSAGTSTGKLTFTLDISEDFIICITGKKIDGGYIGKCKYQIQLEKGETATDYVPYISDWSTVNVTRQGINMLDGNILAKAQNNTKNYGVTITYNEDTGIFTFNTGEGVSTTGNAKQYLCKHSFPAINGKKYVLSVTKIDGEISGSESTPYVWIGRGDTEDATNTYLNTSLKGGSKTGTLESEYITSMWFTFPTDMKLNNYKVKIQLEEGNSATEHQTYVAPITKNADENGKVTGLTSVYHTTVLTTDTDGVITQCDYYKDIDKAFNELTTNIALSGGN